jgi:hypothetical protein
MRITSGGNVGINTTGSTTSTPHLFLGTNLSMFNGGSDDSYFGSNFYFNSAWFYRTANKASMIQQDGGTIIFKNTDTTGTANAALTWSERMRITSGGELYWNLTGTTGGSLNGGGVLFRNNNGKYVQISTGVTFDTGLIYFYKSDGAGSVTNTGSISTSGNLTLYNTTSDYRFKQDLKDFNGIEKILAIKMYDFAWKLDNTRSYGVMAHELAEVLPYAVYGKKDAIQEDGEIQLQQVDYSKIVPILVKAIQELKAEIEQLKNK